MDVLVNNLMVILAKMLVNFVEGGATIMNKLLEKTIKCICIVA